MKKENILLFVLIVSVLANVWFVIGLLTKEKQTNSAMEKEQQAEFPHLSHRIMGEYDRDLILHFVELRSLLRKEVEAKYGENFALYFEYLPTGTSIGVNDRVEFFPGSLLKVPYVMAYYHDLLDQKDKDPLLTIQEDDLDEKFGTLWKKGAGAQIRAGEAVRLALVESDNTAINVIQNHVETEEFNHIYEEIDAPLTTSQGGKIVSITPKEYASILKSLYFASVLSKKDSNHILDLLSKTPFDNKLRAGVPEDVKVSHKIGVYENLEIPVYADCGIVYLPRRNYLLCMASRSSEQIAIERMSTVSKLIYDYVSQYEKGGEHK